ncbi:nuclear transport factor 2 family protein [Methylobacterium sp.]|uniref:nuclear transport factor 2 family protein n=1 Tax=Methylobacterium sp. TaxID=409 RepID=UPI003B007FD0
MRTSVETVLALLADAANPSTVAELVAPDATYVSLNYDNPDLKRIMPWCGSHSGAQSIVETFVNVNRHWEILAFDVLETFGSDERVAVFVSCTFRSRVMDRTLTSPVAIFAKVDGGKVTHMQFMEDTFGTASTFRSGGAWTFRADPGGAEVTI